MNQEKLYGKELLLWELEGCVNFFLKEANNREDSPGYGLVRDKSVLSPEIASIASVGYGFAALVIGAERGMISREEGEKRAVGAMKTFLYNMESTSGFYYHFVNLETARREWNSEVSVIDTAIFLCGAITAGEYFGNEAAELAEKLVSRVEWKWYTDCGAMQFYMGYKPEEGFFGHWDLFAEQLMMYVLAAGGDDYELAKKLYDAVPRNTASFGGQEFLYSYGGALFTYQFSHAWIDFRNLADREGIDWFENSIRASRANRDYCIGMKEKFRTFGENAWGTTACVGPRGYSGAYGAKPAVTDVDELNDGTIPPCGAAGSVVFTPEESIRALEYMYNTYPKLRCEYGFRDAYNLDGEAEWYAEECIGIDKGISLVMIENYLSGLIWKCFMKNERVKKGLKRLGFERV